MTKSTCFLPFVFARGDKPFLRSGLPLLVGMALTFAAVASLAALGGGWAVEANRWGRWIAVALLGFFGLTLLIPSLAERITRPLVRWGSRLSSFGISTTPCRASAKAGRPSSSSSRISARR